MGTVVCFEGGFVGEDSPEHMCGDLSVNESMGGGEQVVVVTVEAIFEGFGSGGELLLQSELSPVLGDVGGQPWVPHTIDVAVDHIPESRRGSEGVEMVVADIAVVCKVGSRVLATRLK